MATAWTKLVTETFKKNRKTNKNYKFKDALIDAKKLYKKTTRSVGTAVVGKVTKSLRKTLKNGGKRVGGDDTLVPVPEAVTTGHVVTKTDGSVVENTEPIVENTEPIVENTEPIVENTTPIVITEPVVAKTNGKVVKGGRHSRKSKAKHTKK